MVQIIKDRWNTTKRNVFVIYKKYCLTVIIMCQTYFPLIAVGENIMIIQKYKNAVNFMIHDKSVTIPMTALRGEFNEQLCALNKPTIDVYTTKNILSEIKHVLQLHTYSEDFQREWLNLDNAKTVATVFFLCPNVLVPALLCAALHKSHDSLLCNFCVICIVLLAQYIFLDFLDKRDSVNKILKYLERDHVAIKYYEMQENE